MSRTGTAKPPTGPGTAGPRGQLTTRPSTHSGDDNSAISVGVAVPFLRPAHFIAVQEHGHTVGEQQGRDQPGHAEDLGGLAGADTDLLRFTATISALRADHPTFHRRRFFSGKPRSPSTDTTPDVAWFRPDGRPMTVADWDRASGRSLAGYLNGAGIRCSDLTGSQMTDADFFLCFNSGDGPVDFKLPPLAYTTAWTVEVDTAGGVWPDRVEPNTRVRAQPHSLLVLREPIEPTHAPDKHSGHHKGGWPPHAL